MNTPINFKLAKLLKEKGFEQNPMKHINQATLEGTLVFPTISEIVMWLYEKHGIWIWVEPTGINDKFCYKYRLSDGDGTKVLEWFKSPTKAYEGAIEYTLKNLI